MTIPPGIPGVSDPQLVGGPGLFQPSGTPSGPFADLLQVQIGAHPSPVPMPTPGHAAPQTIATPAQAGETPRQEVPSAPVASFGASAASAIPAPSIDGSEVAPTKPTSAPAERIALAATVAKPREAALETRLESSESLPADPAKPVDVASRPAGAARVASSQSRPPSMVMDNRPGESSVRIPRDVIRTALQASATPVVSGSGPLQTPSRPVVAGPAMPASSVLERGVAFSSASTDTSVEAVMPDRSPAVVPREPAGQAADVPTAVATKARPDASIPMPPVPVAGKMESVRIAASPATPAAVRLPEAFVSEREQTQQPMVAETTPEAPLSRSSGDLQELSPSRPIILVSAETPKAPARAETGSAATRSGFQPVSEALTVQVPTLVPKSTATLASVRSETATQSAAPGMQASPVESSMASPVQAAVVSHSSAQTSTEQPRVPSITAPATPATPVAPVTVSATAGPRFTHASEIKPSLAGTPETELPDADVTLSVPTAPPLNAPETRRPVGEGFGINPQAHETTSPLVSGNPRPSLPKAPTLPSSPAAARETIAGTAGEVSRQATTPSGIQSGSNPPTEPVPGVASSPREKTVPSAVSAAVKPSAKAGAATTPPIEIHAAPQPLPVVETTLDAATLLAAAGLNPLPPTPPVPVMNVVAEDGSEEPLDPGLGNDARAQSRPEAFTKSGNALPKPAMLQGFVNTPSTEVPVPTSQNPTAAATTRSAASSAERPTASRDGVALHGWTPVSPTPTASTPSLGTNPEAPLTGANLPSAAQEAEGTRLEIVQPFTVQTPPAATVVLPDDEVPTAPSGGPAQPGLKQDDSGMATSSFPVNTASASPAAEEGIDASPATDTGRADVLRQPPVAEAPKVSVPVESSERTSVAAFQAVDEAPHLTSVRVQEFPTHPAEDAAPRDHSVRAESTGPALPGASFETQVRPVLEEATIPSPVRAESLPAKTASSPQTQKTADLPVRESDRPTEAPIETESRPQPRVFELRSGQVTLPNTAEPLSQSFPQVEETIHRPVADVVVARETVPQGQTRPTVVPSPDLQPGAVARPVLPKEPAVRESSEQRFDSRGGTRMAEVQIQAPAILPVPPLTSERAEIPTATVSETSTQEVVPQAVVTNARVATPTVERRVEQESTPASRSEMAPELTTPRAAKVESFPMPQAERTEGAAATVSEISTQAVVPQAVVTNARVATPTVERRVEQESTPASRSEMAPESTTPRAAKVESFPMPQAERTEVAAATVSEISTQEVVPQAVVMNARVATPAVERRAEKESNSGSRPEVASVSNPDQVSKPGSPVVPTVIAGPVATAAPQETQPSSASRAELAKPVEARPQPEFLISSAPRRTNGSAEVHDPVNSGVTFGGEEDAGFARSAVTRDEGARLDGSGGERPSSEFEAPVVEAQASRAFEAVAAQVPTTLPESGIRPVSVKEPAIRPESKLSESIVPRQASSLTVPTHEASAESAENLNAETAFPLTGERAAREQVPSKTVAPEQTAVVPGPVFEEAFERPQTAPMNASVRTVQAEAPRDVFPNATAVKPEIVRQPVLEARPELMPRDGFHPAPVASGRPGVAPETGQAAVRQSQAQDRTVTGRNPSSQDDGALLRAPAAEALDSEPVLRSEEFVPATTPAPGLVQSSEPAARVRSNSLPETLVSARGSESPVNRSPKAPEVQVAPIQGNLAESRPTEFTGGAYQTGSTESPIAPSSGAAVDLRPDVRPEPVVSNTPFVEPKSVTARSGDEPAGDAGRLEVPTAAAGFDRSTAFQTQDGASSPTFDAVAAMQSSRQAPEATQTVIAPGSAPVLPGSQVVGPAGRRTAELNTPRVAAERTSNSEASAPRSETALSQGFIRSDSLPVAAPKAMSQEDTDQRGREQTPGQSRDNSDVPAGAKAPEINAVAESIRTQVLPESRQVPTPPAQAAPVLGSTETLPPVKSDIRSGAVHAAHAHRSLETRDLQLGTPVASKEKTMAYEPTTDKFAGDGTQALPGDALRHSATPGGLDRSMMPVTALLSGLIPPAAPLEPAVPSDAASAQRARMHESVDRLQSMMAAHATSVVVGHVDELRAVLRPEAGTEIHLHVRRDADRVEMTARCQGGDVAAWQSSWADLQQRLRTQGVSLQALEVGARNPGSGTGAGADPDRQRPQSQNLSADDRESGRRESPNGRRTQTEPATTQETVARRPARRVTPRVAEYWA